jgi:hypothetical protein
MRARSSGPSSTSSAPSASSSRSRRRAPTSGTTSRPRCRTQAIAIWATVAPCSPAGSRRRSTRRRLWARFSPWKRGLKALEGRARRARARDSQWPRQAGHARGRRSAVRRSPSSRGGGQDLRLGARARAGSTRAGASAMGWTAAARRRVLRADLGEADVADVPDWTTRRSRRRSSCDRDAGSSGPAGRTRRGRSPGARGRREECSRPPAGSGGRRAPAAVGSRSAPNFTLQLDRIAEAFAQAPGR